MALPASRASAGPNSRRGLPPTSFVRTWRGCVMRHPRISGSALGAAHIPDSPNPQSFLTLAQEEQASGRPQWASARWALCRHRVVECAVCRAQVATGDSVNRGEPGRGTEVGRRLRAVAARRSADEQRPVHRYAAVGNWARDRRPRRALRNTQDKWAEGTGTCTVSNFGN